MDEADKGSRDEQKEEREQQERQGQGRRKTGTEESAAAAGGGLLMNMIIGESRVGVDGLGHSEESSGSNNKKNAEQPDDVLVFFRAVHKIDSSLD